MPSVLYVHVLHLGFIQVPRPVTLARRTPPPCQRRIWCEIEHHIPVGFLRIVISRD